MNKKIHLNEFISSYILLSIVSLLGVGVYCAFKASGENTYISAIIAFIINLIFIIFFLIIWNYKPDLPIYEKTKKLFGKVIGNIINILLFLICINLLISGTYNFLTFINSQILPQTPIIFLSLISTLIAYYFVSKGIRTIFRSSTIIFVINVILFSIAIVNLVVDFDISNFFPFLKDGMSPVFKGSIYISIQTVIPLFTLLIIPKNSIESNKHSTKYLIYSSIFVYLLIFLLFVFILGNLGIDLSKYYTYPEYMVLKNIEVFGFIDRIENVLTLQWIFGFLFAYSFLLYYLKEIINKSFYIKTKYNIEMIIICIIIVIFGSIAFKNDIVYAKYIYDYSPYAKYIFIGVLLTLSIFILFKKNKNVV